MAYHSIINLVILVGTGIGAFALLGILLTCCCLSARKEVVSAEYAAVEGQAKPVQAA